MIVYIVRSTDSNAHEGDDGVAAVFNNKDKAYYYANDFNDSDHRRQGICYYTYYVEEWEVE